MLKEITPSQIKIISTIISIRKLKEYKADMVSSFSEGRTTSTKGLTYAEADKMINYLNAANDPTHEKCYKMRGKILSMAHELQWYKPGGKLDYSRINEWCIKFGYLHKRLDHYSYGELPKLVTQFSNMYSDFIKKL